MTVQDLIDLQYNKCSKGTVSIEKKSDSLLKDNNEDVLYRILHEKGKVSFSPGVQIESF